MTRGTGSQLPASPIGSEGRTRPFGVGSGILILVITALKAVSAVPLSGLWPGLLESLVFAALLVALLKLILWPISLITARPEVVNRLKRMPGVLVALAWPWAVGWILLLDPDHGLLHRYQLPTWPGLIVEWLVILFTPMLTLRWFKVRALPGMRSDPPSWKRLAWLTAGVCSCLAVIFGLVVLAKHPRPATVAPSAVPWQYRSREHRLSLTFPSSSWKVSDNSGGTVSFRGDRPGVLLRVAITAVEPRTRDEFASSKEKLKALTVGDDKIVGKAVFREGVTPARDPYLLAHYVARVAPVSYEATALVWLRARGLAVQLTFDAQRTDAQNLDHSEFESMAEAMLLSLEDDTKRPEPDQVPAASVGPIR